MIEQNIRLQGDFFLSAMVLIRVWTERNLSP